MPVSLEQFIQQLQDSGLISSETLQGFLPPHDDPKDVESLARRLIRKKAVTEFQVREIYKGNGQSLILDNYMLLEKIGQGGMGQVFKARHRRMDRVVAIKILPASTMKDPATVARFEREVRAASRITHPNIVTAFDAGQAGNVHFLVMELVDGIDLSARVKQDGPLFLKQALKAILDAARGLEAAHQHGIVHRDIKPGNLLLDKQGNVKILDMGLARLDGEVAAQAELTATGMIMGTVDYMAPEQALNTKSADARADVYSLGCSLFYLLTGRPTYDGDTLMAKMLAHREQPIPSICALRPDSPPQLDFVFQRMVAKSVDQRYQTMTELIADLQRLSTSPESIVNVPIVVEVSDSPTARVGDSNAGAASATIVQGAENSNPLPSINLQTDPTELARPAKARRRQQPIVIGSIVGGLLLMMALGIILNLTSGSRTETKVTSVTRNPFKVNEPAAQKLTDKPQQTQSSPPEEKKSPKSGDVQPKPVVEKKEWPVPPAPVDLPEPPSLQDWLKDRKVRTVAQDGRGEFKTIQEAINNLQSGQVVRVLDRGPYRETLLIQPPADTGLVSDVGTVVEARGERSKIHGNDYGRNQLVNATNGFRLSGLAFVEASTAGHQNWEACFFANSCSDLVIEDCLFHFDRPSHVLAPAFRMTWRDAKSSRLPNVVRHCVMDGNVILDCSTNFPVNSVVTFEQNWLREVRLYHSLMISGMADTFRIRHNVIENKSPEAVWLMDLKGTNRLEITNNSIYSSSISVSRSLSEIFPSKVVMLNNMCSYPPSIHPNVGDFSTFRQAARDWYVHANLAYTTAKSLPNQPFEEWLDSSGSGYMSIERALPNYLHLVPDSYAAVNGVGGAWPAYQGAFPPGPVPSDGDWFSRLKLRWQDVLLDRGTADSVDTIRVGSVTVPKKIEEAASFDEWVKGRTILTVSQDGQGQFKTVQAALNQMQAGQAVEILDAGPYRETLMTTAKIDTGLFSRHQTVIETNGNRPDGGTGHFIMSDDRFRIHGVMFSAPPSSVHDEKVSTLMVQVTTGFVIENCLFRAEHPDTFSLNAFWPAQGGRWPVLELRENIFDTAPVISFQLKTPRATAVIERNWFRNAQGGKTGLLLHGAAARATVRNNVFSGKDPTYAGLMESADAGLIEFTNNTLPGGIFGAKGSIGPAQLSVLNNIFAHPIQFDPTIKSELPAAMKAWNVANNVYAHGTADELEFPTWESEYIAEPMFLSVDPSDPAYLHIPAGSPEARRGRNGDWPAYLGAFPPGPPPSTGTWFSRLREHWAKIPEPAKKP